MSKFTREDAYARIAQARVGCYESGKVTTEYLYELRRCLYDWISSLDCQIYMDKMGDKETQDV